MIDLNRYFYNDDLREFEDLNVTCKSIYELGDINVLIILKNGENLTDYLEIENPKDVAYISEDLSGKINLERQYYLGQVFKRSYGDNSPLFVRYTDNPFRNIRAMVVQGVSDKVTSLNDMFRGLSNLKTVSGLDTWDVSNVETMDSLFMECLSLKTIHGIDGWNVGNVRDMTWAFNECRSLKDISFLENWDISNVKSMRAMFKYCDSLEDISPILSLDFKEGCDTKNMFYDMAFANEFQFKKPELKLENSFEASNIKPALTCQKCGSENLIFGGGEIICRNCNSLVKSHFELKCPDCGCNDVKYTRMHDLTCSRCERIILENVHFDTIIR